MAEWLNSAFYGLDNAFFIYMNSLAKNAGGFFTPFFVFVSLFGKGGIFFLVLGGVLMLFKKTRRVGSTILLAVGVGALLTNVVIKNSVARMRPYLQSENYAQMWQYVGAHAEKEFSFPSGHTTVTMTSMMAIFLTCNKKYSWLGFVFVLIMGLSRIYLVAHYFTDVVGGIIVGAVAGFVAYLISNGLYKVIKKHSNKKFCKGFLEFDVLEKIKTIKK